MEPANVDPLSTLDMTRFPARPNWLDIVRLPLRFDGYAHWGSHERCADVAEAAARDYAHTGRVPDDQHVLLSCLFYERRRWRHYGFDPEEDDMPYLVALVEALRHRAVG